MRKLIFVVLMFLIFNGSFAQTSNNVITIIDIHKNGDTLRVKKFDSLGRLVFSKLYPAATPYFPVIQILTYEYDGDEMIRFISCSSNLGVSVYEYVHDKGLSRKMKYSYKSDEKGGKINNLTAINNIDEIKLLKQYNDACQKNNKYLCTITYLKDTIPTREVTYEPNGDSSMVELYKYNKGLLVNKRTILPHNKAAFNDVAYRYDGNGRELEWFKIFSGSDTSYRHENIFLNDKLMEEKSIEKSSMGNPDELEITKYKYDNSERLIFEETTSNGQLFRQKKYTYNANGTINKIQIADKWAGYNFVSYYFY